MKLSTSTASLAFIVSYWTMGSYSENSIEMAYYLWLLPFIVQYYPDDVLLLQTTDSSSFLLSSPIL